MKYGKINLFDVANGEGIRVSLFVSGCNLHCEGCFNKEAQDFEFGSDYTIKTRNMILNRIKDPRIAGLSILGGEPMCQKSEDLLALCELARQVNELGKDVWLWTGYTWGELWENPITPTYSRYLLGECKYIIEGRFILTQRDITLPWRGSTNQRIIDVQRTLAEEKIILKQD